MIQNSASSLKGGLCDLLWGARQVPIYLLPVERSHFANAISCLQEIRARVLVEDDPADPYSLSGSLVWTSDIHIERSGSNIIILIFGEIMLKRNMPSAQNPRKRFVQNLVLAKREYSADQTFEEYYILNDVFRFPRTTLSERSLVLRVRNEDTELTR